MARREIVVDSFAGGGGASLGIQRALGRSPELAINHDATAIAVHLANHPETEHCTEDLWKIAPLRLTRGRPVGLLWCSPDCKHFSRAKGSKPVEKKIRSLAWIAVRWAIEVAPRVIIIENVREFEEWGPLVPAFRCADCGWRGTEGQAHLARKRRRCPRCESGRLKQTPEQLPDPERKGITFRRFIGRLRGLGYEVSWRVLDAADYGAPTHRKRLFLVARNDGRPIAWPEPSHGNPARLDDVPLFAVPRKPWRTAAECIEWTLTCPSIFERARPLAEATLRRIALGIKRYVLDNPRPFLVGCGGPAHAGEPRDVDRPAGVVMPKSSAAVVTPFLAHFNHAGPELRGQTAQQPLSTLTASRGHGVVAPVLARIGQTGGNGKYAGDVQEPLGTLVSKAEHLLVAPALVQTGFGERAGQAPRVLDLHSPLGTCLGTQKHALVAAFCAKHYGGFYEGVGVPIDVPLPTATERSTQNQLAAATLVYFNHGEKQWNAPDEPARTVTTGNHASLVYAFLVKYFGTAIGCACDAPLPTATEKDRCGLVCVTIAGQRFVIVDIGMRMLVPRELARCQGFHDGYALPGEQLDGTRTSATKLIGNSVPPDLAEAMVRANYKPVRRTGARFRSPVY